MAAQGETGRGIGYANSFYENKWKKRNECPNVGGVSIGSRNGAPSRRDA